MENLRILILAAGKSTRMKSKYAKVLQRVGGRMLIEHVLRSARSISGDIWVVVGHTSDKVKASIPEVKFVDQREQLGSGHAVMTARDQFAEYTGDLLVLSGAVPLIAPDTLKTFVDFHRKEGYRASVITADADDPTGYGRIVRRNESDVDAIVEQRDATPEILKIREINSGIYVFDAPALFKSLTKIRNDNAQREYYLPDVIGILVSQPERVGAFKVRSAAEILGINTRQELAVIDLLMRRRKCESLMAEGVTIIDPHSTIIDGDVRIGGDTVIGDDVTIHSFSRISNSTVGPRSTVLEGCIVVDSALGEDVSIGPYAHLRMGTTIDGKARVGNFVEIKKSALGSGTKSMHLAYLGDATIGCDVNIGAGVITCNYDGVSKYPTVIEDGAFIGTDSQLIAPVRIGRNAYVAAGSSITDDVPPEALAIARGRQAVKEGWAKNRKKK